MEGPSHGHVGNDAARPRDPTTEQGLEADATVLIPSTYATPATVWHGRRNAGRHANGKKATTAVTRNGCRRGTSFEGSELRCGDLATAPARIIRLSDAAVFGTCEQETQRTS
jgi:hypothetical protein